MPKRSKVNTSHNRPSYDDIVSAEPIDMGEGIWRYNGKDYIKLDRLSLYLSENFRTMGLKAGAVMYHVYDKSGYLYYNPTQCDNGKNLRVPIYLYKDDLLQRRYVEDIVYLLDHMQRSNVLKYNLVQKVNNYWRTYTVTEYLMWIRVLSNAYDVLKDICEDEFKENWEKIYKTLGRIDYFEYCKDSQCMDTDLQVKDFSTDMLPYEHTLLKSLKFLKAYR